MPHVRYLATIREPVGQALSWESMQINHDYYRNYPGKKCAKTRYLPIEHKKYSTPTLRSFIRSIGDCVATEFRKNITLMLVANMVEAWPPPTNESHGWPGPAVALTANWFVGSRLPRYHLMKPMEVVEALQKYFFLVAPVERMNQFLVLLAIHMGWKYESLYYVTCKPQDIDVRRSDFVKYFPHLAEKLDTATRPMAEAYRWAKESWDSHIKRLGPWFEEEVQKFIDGLSAYQMKHHHPFKYRWATYRYLDGHTEDC